MTKLPERLRLALEKEADTYTEEVFKLNPNGFTVAPYVNGDILATAFEQGAETLFQELCRLAEGEFDQSLIQKEVERRINEVGFNNTLHFSDGARYQRSLDQALIEGLRAEIERLKEYEWKYNELCK